tara:strand:+ start:420 stop:665 length:246 start_codon:yes stop_codon:yes gene_type:complete
MATYKFPQFNTQIVNPTIEVDSDSIIVHALRNEISLFVSLSTTDSMLYGVEVENIPVTNLNYEGEANLMTRALEGLAQYEV